MSLTMYEVNARPMLHEFKVNNINEVPEQFIKQLAMRKINYLYLQGVWQTGTVGLEIDRNRMDTYKGDVPDLKEEDVLGSPFAIVSYEVHQCVGTNQDLLDFKKRLNESGIRLILDFVPNHAAIDSVDGQEHPEYFVSNKENINQLLQLESGIFRGRPGKEDGFIYSDTIQYNFCREDTVEARIQDFLKVSQLSDGVRCDMAHAVVTKRYMQNWGSTVQQSAPQNEFWEQAIQRVKQTNDQYIFVAEVFEGYEQDLVNLGFDYVYDKCGLYDLLVGGNLENIKKYIQNDALIHKKVHFIESHDEPRAVVAFKEPWVANVAALICYTLPGMRMYSHGQFVGRRNRLRVQIARSYQIEKDFDAASEKTYAKVLEITSRPIFHEGVWQYAEVFGHQEAWRLMAWMWTLGNQKVLVVANFSDQKGHGKVQIGCKSDKLVLVDQLTMDRWVKDGKEAKSKGLKLWVEKWYCLVLDIVEV